jgi:hypothetical protein
MDPDYPAGAGPRLARQQVLTRVLVVVAAAVAVVAVAAVVATAVGTATWLGTATVVTLIAAPVVRVVWLGVRWLRLGDRRYAAVCAGLLVIMAVAAAVG